MPTNLAWLERGDVLACAHVLGSSNARRENQTADRWSFTVWQRGEPAFRPAAR